MLQPVNPGGNADDILKPVLVMLSGCSGGGKSTLLAALAARGYATAEEPGRLVVREEMARGGDALPWGHAEAFAKRVILVAIEQYQAAETRDGITIFDRGLVDAYAWFLRSETAMPPELVHAVRQLRYARTVFMAPPWPELFANDAERRHGFDEAVAEYRALVETYARLGYQIVDLPKVDVAARADFVASRLEAL